MANYMIRLGKKLKYRNYLGFVMLLSLSACGPEENTVPDSSIPEANQAINIESFGVVRTTRERVIAIEFPAVVRKIHTLDGQAVSKGTVIMELDMGPYNELVADAISQLEIARLRLVQMQNEYERGGASKSSEYRKLENSIASAEQELEQMQREHDELHEKLVSESEPDLKKLALDLSLARSELRTREEALEQKQTLFDRGRATTKELENTKSVYETALSREKSLELSIESLENQRRQELEHLQLSIDQNRLNITNLRIQIDQLIDPEISGIEIQKAQIAVYEGWEFLE